MSVIFILLIHHAIFRLFNSSFVSSHIQDHFLAWLWLLRFYIASFTNSRKQSQIWLVIRKVRLLNLRRFVSTERTLLSGRRQKIAMAKSWSHPYGASFVPNTKTLFSECHFIGILMYAMHLVYVSDFVDLFLSLGISR